MFCNYSPWLDFLILVFAAIGFSAFLIFLYGFFTSAKDLEGY